MAGDRIDQLYNALKADGSSVPSRDIFRKNMLASGKTGYKNRLDFFNAMKADGADVGNTYEDFAKRLGLHAVKKGVSNAGTPMSETDKTRFIVGANNIAYQGQQTVKNANRYNNLKQRKQKQQNDFGRVNIGAHQTPYGGDANNVLKDERTGQYVTSDSETTNNLAEAQEKQAVLDEYGKAYQNAVDTGEIPSVFDVRDINGNYDLQENIGKDGTYLTEEGAQNQLERKLQDAYARKKEIEDAIAEDNQKNGNPLLSYSASLGGGNGRDAESSDYRNKLATSLSLVTQQIGALEAVKQYPTSSWGEDAWKALDNTAFTAKTWDFGLSDFATMGQMERIKTKMDNNIPLSGSDKMLLNSKLGADAAAALEDEKMGSIYRWTKIAGQSLPFMADFFLTGGYGGITKAMGRGALKFAAKRGMGKVSAAILKNTGIVAGDVIGSYAMAGTEQAMKTGADIMQRHMGNLYQDENGNYVFGTFDENGNLLHEGGETIGKALYKGLTSAMVENYTEKLFGHNYGIKKGALNFMEKHGMGRAADFFKNIGQSGWYSGSKKWMEKFGINGFGEEVMEEEIGIPLHALLDGDNKMSDLLDPKQQLDIIGGMAISVGSMYAMGMGTRPIKGAYNRAQYYRFKHKVDVADSNAQQLLGDNWESWKEQMDNATNDKMGGVLYNILHQRDNMSKEQINAAIQYGVNLMKMRGYNLTKTAEMNAKELTGEQNTEEDKHDNDIDNAYSEGHEAEGADTHSIQLEQNASAMALANMLGVSEEKLHDMSDDELEAMTGQNDKLDQAIYDYQTSTARYQGVMDNANDKVDMAAQQAAMLVDQTTDLSRGTVRNATIKATKGAEDYGVYIISGNIATHDDGTINVSDSDQMILYYDPTTGRKEHADPSRFAALGDENPAEEVKAQAIADAKEKAIREVAGIIDGKVEVGSQFDVTDADGTQHTYEVLADNGDGTAMITLDGNVEQNPYSFEDLQNMKDLEDQKRLEATKEERELYEKERAQKQAESSATSETAPVVGQTEQITQEVAGPIEDSLDYGKVINDNGNVVTVSVKDRNGDSLYDDAVAVFLTDGKTSGKANDMLGISVLDEDGNITRVLAKRSNVTVDNEMSLADFKAMRQTELGAQQTEEGVMPSDSSVVVENGGENATAENEQNVQTGEENAQEEQVKVPSFEDGTPIPVDEEGIADPNQMTAQQAAEYYDNEYKGDAEQILSDFVNQTKNDLNKAQSMKIKGKNNKEMLASRDAKEKAIADAQAAYDSAKAISDAYNERQLAKEEGTPEGRKNLIEKAKAKFARLKGKDEWKNQTQALYNETIGKVLHRLYDGLGVNVFDHEPQTVEEYVSSSIAPYSLNYEGTETSKGVKQETGLQRKDFTKSHVLAAEGKGVTVDDFVHKLWDNRPSQLENVSDQEIRNTLLDLITSDMNAYDMQHVIENNRIAQAEKEIEDEKTAAENAQMSNQSIESAPNESENDADNANDGAESTAVSEAEVAPSENENFPSKLKEPSQEESTEVPEDSTPEKPLGEQKDSAPFSAKDEGEQETPEERAANVEKNKVDGADVVDAIIGKKMRKSLARIAKMMGAKIQYQYTDKKSNGWYDDKTKTIYLALDSSIIEGVQFVFGHEMTHEIKDKNPAAFEELKNLVKNSMGEDVFNAETDKMQERYKKGGASYWNDRNAIEEEVVADQIGGWLRDLNYAHTLALKMSHPLLAKIHEIINRIRMAFHGTEYTEQARQIMRSIEQAYVKTANGTFEDKSTGEDARYSLRQKPEPTKKGIGYKVFVLKDGKLYPPMVANPNGAETPVGVWLDADAAPIAGESKTGRPQVKQGGKGTQGGSGKLAYRPGWHLGVIPYALQFNRKDAEGNKTLFPANFVFAEVEYAADKDYQDEAYQEGINANGKYQHSLAGLKHLPTDGFYMYRTNPNPETDPWVITGAMKVNRILTRAEQADLVKKAGREPQQIQEGDIVTDDVVSSINQQIANMPKFSLKVYHGSGADFSEFDFSHMGDGAGSQAFGWGGYVTSSKKIGKDYAMLKDNPHSNEKAEAKEFLETYPTYESFLANHKRIGASPRFTEDEKKDFYEGIVKAANASRNLYEVNIPDDNGDNYIDYDAPLTDEFIDKVVNALPSIRAYDIEDFKKNRSFEDLYRITSMRIVEDENGETNGVFNDDKAVSQLLSSLGYTGIKYKAGRNFGGAEEGDTNYVIFKPEDMQIAEHTKFSLKSNGSKDFGTRLKSAIDETETNPSDAQKESGNYKKGHVKFGGYDYTIENPRGSVRSGVDSDGKPWSIKMHDTYGYIRGKFGKDGDHLDMFINDKADLDNWNGDVYVVDQVNPDGSFDEHKVMYGYDSMDDAKKAYLANYSEGWQGLGNITGASKDEFDKWLDTSKRKLKPFADYAKVKFSQAQSVEVDNNPMLSAIHTLYTKGKEFASKLFNMKYFDVVKTPDFMKNVGLTGDKFTIRYGVISRHFGKDEQHDFTEEEWKQLPKALSNPILITEYYQDENQERQKGYRLYTPLKLSDGSYVVVSAEVKNAGRNLEINAINTIFGRNAVSDVHDKVVWQNPKITPEQSSLLNGNNPHQYPTTQELSAAKIDNSSETSKKNGEKFSLKDEEYQFYANRYGTDAEDIAKFDEAMQTGNVQLGHWAMANIRRAYRINHSDMKLSMFAKMFSSVRNELYSRYGNLDELQKKYEDEVMAARNVMEAAQKKAEEEQASRQKHFDELALLPADELDKRYMDAINKGDEITAREMLDESARRKGYGDVNSEYQGEYAWAAPSNPRYDSDEERRADLENSPDVNLEDIALGYSLQPDDYFENPRAYMNNTAHGLESSHVIKNALDALKRGEKDVKVKVYRAVPTSIKEGKLRNGDWVTPSKKYAEMHGNNRFDGKYRIIEDEVPANQLWWDGNDANEFGFDDGKEYKYKNAKNNRKLNDLVTYDDNGNVIPPSKRFNSRKSDIRFSLAGERGAANMDKAEEVTTRLDNLNVARKMEEAKKDAKAIKLATGWERGADGKWRYEIPDIKRIDLVGNLRYIKNHPDYARYIELLSKQNRFDFGFSTEELTDAEQKELGKLRWKYADFFGRKMDNNYKLDAFVDAPELFKAYPKLADVGLHFVDDENDDAGGWFTPSTNSITINKDKVVLHRDYKSILAHEIQHAIQYIEGFAKGGSSTNVRDRIQKIIDENSEYADYAIQKMKTWTGFKKAAMNLGKFNTLIKSDNPFVKDKAIEYYWDAMNLLDSEEGSKLTNEYDQLGDLNAKQIAETGYHVDEAVKELNRLADEVWNSIPKGNKDALGVNNKLKDALKNLSDDELYWNLAGEVESRNVEKRLGMTDEERRNSLASETEDVAREDQIFLGVDDSDTKFSLRDTNDYNKRLNEWKKKNGLEADAKPMEKPEPYGDGSETSFDFAQRMTDYVRNQALWKTAPKPTGYKEALEEWKKRNGLAADAFPPSHPNYEDYADLDQYNADVAQYRKDKELWKDAPKPKDFDLSLDLDNMNKQLRNVRRAVLNQKNYDKRTVKAISDLIRDMLTVGWGDGLSRGKVSRLLSAAKNATGAADVKKHIDNVMSILADNYLHRLETAYDNLIKTKGVKADQSGVIKVGSLDYKGQAFLNEYKKAMTMDDTALAQYMTDIDNDSSEHPDNAELNGYRLDGINAAILFKQQVGGNDADIAALEGQIKALKDKADKTKDDRELLKALQQKLFENKFDRITMYENLLFNIQATVSESKSRAKDFKQKKMQLQENIRHMANIDLEGVDSTYYDTTTAKKKFVNNPLLRAILSSTYTFEQFLKFFGQKHTANGEGRLYNYFTKLNQEALDEQQLYNEMNRKAIDDKATEIFGKKTKLTDLVGKSGKGMDIEVADYSDKDTGKRTIHLKQGQMLYIYLVNKQTDGQMKLRAMGIDETDVAAIEANLEPRMKQMGEWLQDEYLPECQRRYQEVHTRFFGAPMKEVENYFPLVINQRARNVKEDVNQDTEAMSQLAGTSTGAIVTRRVNTIPLDIENADAFEVAFNHLQEMEEWAAMLPFRQDINTLLSYTHFRNQVQNMSSVAYGSGKTLWDEFKQTAQIAAGTYKPKVNKGMMDSRIAAAMGGVAMAKISGRLWTAIKQSQSATVFLPECDFTRFVKNGVNPYGSWKWTMENIPDFRKRVESLTYGDVKLRQYLDELEKWHDWTKTIANVGMFPNILVDGVTCAVGARSVYETEVNRLAKLGYPKEKAEEKAYYKAVAAYNKTQQSSGGMYLSPMQVDRTYVSAALSLFKNANYAYGRMQIEACRGLARTYDFWGGKHKTALIESMTRQIKEEDGLEEDVARAVAKAAYNRTFRQSIGRLLNFMTLVPISWAAYKVLPYLLTGDDDDKKKEMIENAALQGFATSLSDNYVIPFASNILNAGLKVEDGKPTFDSEVFKYQNLYINPATSDLANLYSMIGNQKWYSVANKGLMLGVQSLVGFNPETVGALYQAIAEGNFKGNTNKEVQIAVLKAISAPEESIRELYMDELGLKSGDKDVVKKLMAKVGLDGDDIKKVPLEKLEKRYAGRQMLRDNLLTNFAMDDDTFYGYVDKYQQSFEKKIKDKMDKWDEYDKKKADEFFNTTSDPKLKEMIAKKRAKDAKAQTDEQIAKEGLGEKKETETAGDKAYKAARNTMDLAEDISLAERKKYLTKRFAKLDEEYSNQKEAMKPIFLSKHPTFNAYKDMESEYETYSKEIKSLKENLVNAKDRTSVMNEIRKKREEFMGILDALK